MKMSEYQRKLAEQHLDIVDWVIRCRITIPGRPLLTYEDFYQIGCEALCRAAMKYDPDVGSFEAFGSRIVYNAIIDHCRKQNSMAAHSMEMLTDEENEPIVFNTRGEEQDYDLLITGRNIKTKLEELKCSFSGIALRGIEAIELKSLGYSSKEIADRYDTSVNNVNAWISRARTKLFQDPQFRAIFE